MNRLLLALFLALASFAVAHNTKTGKLVGHVDIGPLTPVERPGHKQKVPPEMYKRYKVTVMQPGPHNGQMKSHMLRLVADLKLNSDGDFSTDLAPGEYRIEVHAVSPNSRPMPEAKTVNITAGKTTRVTFSIDTGIR